MFVGKEVVQLYGEVPNSFSFTLDGCKIRERNEPLVSIENSMMPHILEILK